MTSIPTKTEIKADHYQRLLKMNDSMQAVNQMIQMFQANGQAKLQQYQAEARDVWMAIAKEHPEIDFEKIAWEPGKEPNTIIPVQMRLA